MIIFPSKKRILICIWRELELDRDDLGDDISSVCVKI